MKNIIKEIVITIGLVLAIYLLFHIFIQNSVVNNISMQPTLYQGQRLFVEKQLLDLGRGDIIIIRPRAQVAPAGEEFVKRLIGLPGDTIEVTGGKVYVNAVALDEPYVISPPTYTYGPFKVPPDNYFVMGDNRNNSDDSHTGWTVTRKEIVGKAFLRYWPLNKFGLVGNYNLNEQIEQSTLSPEISNVP